MSGFRLRAEGVLRWVYSHDGHAEPTIALDGSFAFQPNRLEYAGYVLAAYRTPWRLEPYVDTQTLNNSPILFIRVVTSF